MHAEIFDKKRILAIRKKFANTPADHYFLLDEIYKLLLEKICGNFENVLNLGAYRGEILSHLPDSHISFKNIIHCDICPEIMSLIPGQKVVADEENLPFKEDSFDLVISAMTLHHTNNLPKALKEILRVLKPGGVFLGNVFGPQTLWQLRQSIINAEKDSGIIPRVSPFIDVKDAGRLLSASKFCMPVSVSESILVNYSSALKLFCDIRKAAQVSVLKNVNRGLATGRTIGKIIAEYEKLCDNQITATFEVVIMTGLKTNLK